MWYDALLFLGCSDSITQSNVCCGQNTTLPNLIRLSGKRIIVTKKNPRQSTHAWGSG